MWKTSFKEILIYYTIGAEIQDEILVHDFSEYKLENNKTFSTNTTHTTYSVWIIADETIVVCWSTWFSLNMPLFSKFTLSDCIYIQVVLYTIIPLRDVAYVSNGSQFEFETPWIEILK